MDVFISHISYIIGTLALGIVIGVKYKDQFEAAFRKAREVALNFLRKN